VYENLHNSEVKLEQKGFAVGFRIEHPQKIINKIQYGDESGRNVKTGKGIADRANKDFFGTEPVNHIAKLPVSSYRLATDRASDGDRFRGVYSFCMCPVSKFDFVCSLLHLFVVFLCVCVRYGNVFFSIHDVLFIHIRV
jgi:hypothetical protein